MIKYSHTISGVTLLLLVLLSGCSSDSGSGPSENNISGVVRLPAQQIAMRRAPSLLARLIRVIIPDTNANLIGLVPVANTTVELVKLDSLGNITDVLDTTSSDPNGAFNFTTNFPPVSTLAVVLPYEPTTTRAIVTTANNTDITPVSEAIFRTIVAEIISSQVSILENFTINEVAALVDLVESMNIDVTTATTFNSAVNAVQNQAGSVLTSMTKSFATSTNVTAFYQNNYASAGKNTTLIPPPQLNGSTAGIDHRIIDGFFGFQGITSLVNGGIEFSDLLLNNMATASYFCDSKSTNGSIFLSAPNGRMIVSPVDGSGSVVGALSADNSLMIYPSMSRIAGVNGNGSGDGGGMRIAMQWDNSTASEGVNLNAAIDGAYNMVWAASHMNPVASSGAGSLGGNGTFTTTTGAATLLFDSASSDTNGRSGFTSSNTSINTMTVDLGSGTFSNDTSPETLSGVYEVFPGNKVIASLGDPGIMLGNLSSNSDFLRGMRIVVPVGQVSPLIAFSATLAGGNMGAGGGMGMGVANCNSNNGGSASSGMMGSSYGEGRALAVAALQSIGLSEANVVGTYNAAAELTTFSEAAGTVLVTSEIRYGTMTFNGAGSISGGNLFYKRNTMDVNNAINGGAPALTITSGNESVNGTYNVSAVNGNMALSLNGLTTGTGFITPDAQFMAFPIEATASGSGSRGILYLLRQP